MSGEWTKGSALAPAGLTRGISTKKKQGGCA